MGADPTDPSWPEVKAAYWRNHKDVRDQVNARVGGSETPRSDWPPSPDFWAWEYVNTLWRVGDRAALDRLVDLADSASDDDELGYLGAGPVEDLVRVFGEELIDDIEDAAARSPNFHRALRGIYGTVIPESIRIRMLPFVPAREPEHRWRQFQGKDPLP